MSSYGDCVSSLRSALMHLDSTVATISKDVSDFPRLITIFKHIRHYELIPQPKLAAAETSLRQEIAPAVERLLTRATRQLDRVERRVATLKAQADLQQDRLTSLTEVKPKARVKKLEGQALARMQILRQRKEALKYATQRLDLQVMQKERESGRYA